ncbi:unnamed protein product [Hydatigera taeniaeformis]|uniref:RRM domain-containing protein n=1 Tax=Hydatigena taeniaeformis TaxID=6205 RepID=A0A3P7FQS3_HYDTA|nr:unnamed protein product [Hydatigera taeniaeformis]
MPTDVSEKEVLTLAIPFGLVENVLITKTGQAMLEFQQQESATNMLTYYDLYSPPVIRGSQTITVQYSKHPHLTTTSKRPLLFEIIENVNRAHQALTWSSSSLGSSSRKVLWMQVTNPSTTPLGYVPFYQALFKFGQILRIVTFKSGSYPQAFIEFAQAVSTDVAKHQLDGCPFAAGGICRTNYSHMEKLDVHQESQYCRDFTKNPLFLSPELSDHQQQQATSVIGAQSWMSPQCTTSLSSSHSASNGLPSVQQLATLDVQTLSAFANEVTQALAIAASRFPEPQSQHLQAQANSIRQLIPLVHIAASANGTTGGKGFVDLNAASGGALVDQSANIPFGSPVLLVTQLNAELMFVEMISYVFTKLTRFVLLPLLPLLLLSTAPTFNLLPYLTGSLNFYYLFLSHLPSSSFSTSNGNFANNGLHTDITGDHAGHPLHSVRIVAVNALLFRRIWGCTAGENSLQQEGLCSDPIRRCKPSEHGHLSVTPAGELEAELTRDYTGSRLHRFRSANSRNFYNICAPNTVLHVSGLPEDISEAKISDLFHKLSGVAPTLVKSMDRDKRMALVEYATLADAVNAIIKVDTYQMRPTSRIRVTFSKSPVTRDFSGS